MPATITDAINEVDISGDDDNLFEHSVSETISKKNQMDQVKAPKSLEATKSVKCEKSESSNDEHNNDKACIKNDQETQDNSSNCCVPVPESPQPPQTPNQPLKDKQQQNSDIIDYTCKYCDRKFLRKTSLNAHTRMHKGFKKYTCDVCDQKFVQAASLRIHKRQRHGQRDGVYILYFQAELKIDYYGNKGAISYPITCQRAW